MDEVIKLLEKLKRYGEEGLSIDEQTGEEIDQALSLLKQPCPTCGGSRKPLIDEQCEYYDRFDNIGSCKVDYARGRKCSLRHCWIRRKYKIKSLKPEIIACPDCSGDEEPIWDGAAKRLCEEKRGNPLCSGVAGGMADLLRQRANISKVSADNEDYLIKLSIKEAEKIAALIKQQVKHIKELEAKDGKEA